MKSLFVQKWVMVCFFLGALLVTACNRNVQTLVCDQWDHPTEIRVTDPILIRVDDSLSFKGDGKSIAKHVTVSPKVGFDVEVLNTKTIAIKPKVPLNHKTVYRVSVDMGEISGKFDVATLSPMFKYTEGNLSMYPEGGEAYYVTGNVETSDYMEPKYIERGFSVSAKGASVTWKHSEDGRTHAFTIDNIQPSSEPYEMEIRYDYSKYDENGKQKASFLIPAKGRFVVADDSFSIEPYHFEITFSSPLDKKQVFAELVSMPGAGKLKFVVDVNRLLIYPTTIREQIQQITISGSLKNVKGETLGEDWNKVFSIPSKAPSVKFISKGSILPSVNGMNLHFQAVNYEKVQVRVSRIYENNILQFLQSNRIDAADVYNLRQVAKVVADTLIVLGSDSRKLSDVANYGLDISRIIKPQRGAIYKVEIRGREKLVENEDEDYWESDYYFGSYQDYSSRTVNVFVSDLGVVAKGSENGTFVFFVTNLITAKPVPGARVNVYNSVNQLVGEGRTDGDGMVSIHMDEYPSAAIITSGEDRTYIKLDNGISLSLSNFEVDGASVKGGQKGFVFGERGVWRPGDDIYITFVSMLSEGVLPANHPVTAVLSNPQGQIVQTLVNKKGSDGMYAFRFKTDDVAPTGNWQVDVTAGGQTYSKTIKIETIKPNKLLIDLRLNDKPVVPSDRIKGDMKVNWLTGNPGKNLEARVEMALSRGSTAFKDYGNFVFEDPSRSFYAQNLELVTGVTDGSGSFSFVRNIDLKGRIPGFLNAVFTTRVFEPSGDFSIDSYQTVISPYDVYVGINVPEQENSWGEKYLDKGKTHNIKIASVDASGVPADLDRVDVEIYQMGWNWWWGSASAESLASFSRDSYNKPYNTFTVPMKRGGGSFTLDLSEEKSGFYFIRVSDPIGGHATSRVTMVSYSYDNQMRGEQSGAARLTTVTDKGKYNVGETAQLSIPSAAGAKALVSISKGSSLLKSFWVECTGNKTIIPIRLEKGMAPNIYAEVSLIQPHNNSSNDAPIRMFGVQRINVEDPSSHLYPVIGVNDEVRPESEVSIKVNERDGRPMSYVLALVDEGLLSLSRYKVPNPWNAFYATEALGVRTWDLYDLVIGAYGAKMERMFAIGGDDEMVTDPSKAKAERFKPVSMFFGPFSLKGKGTGLHKITIPSYIGSLRVMVVATDGRAQGAAEKDVAVNKPLMVQTTMPRVVGVDEEIEVPVTVFAMNDGIGKVTVRVEVETGSSVGGDAGQSKMEGFSVMGDATQSIVVEKSGETMVYFKLKAVGKEGVGKVEVSAKCATDASEEMIEIDVRNPNPLTTVSKTILLKPNESIKADFPLAGKEGTNTAKVEASILPPIDLDYRLEYLLGYPHGCIEQTVSAAFPQLYLGEVMTLSEERILQCENNIKAAIARLPLFSKSGGGFAYWPGTDGGVTFWGTIYATHFLLEAQSKGYSVPSPLLKSSLSYIRTRANRKDDSNLERAYALYVLALSGDAPRGAMNRMREAVSSLPSGARWFLAAAYAADNKKNVASEIVFGMSGGGASSGGASSASAVVSSGAAAERINPFSDSFDSEERVLATAIMTYCMIGDDENGFEALRQLSTILNDRTHFMSTQSTAWALNAVAWYSERVLGDGGAAGAAGATDGSVAGVRAGIDVTVDVAGKKMQIKDARPFAQGVLPSTGLNSGASSSASGKGGNASTGLQSDRKMAVALTNNTSVQTHVVISSRGIPEKGMERDISNGLSLSVTYTSVSGAIIDPYNLEQGTDFTITATVTNTNPLMDYTNLVLSQIFPSGWEFKRDRTDSYYQDFRDDRAYTYFDLGRSQSITVTIRATATYKGRFYLPPTICEAMYDTSVTATRRGGWCEVH